MKLIILATVVLTVSGCASTDHISFGAKPAYSFNFINDGSQKAKDCQLECQKQENQCKLEATAESDTFLETNKEWWASDIARHNKETKDELCETRTSECMTRVCHGSVEKVYLNN